MAVIDELVIGVAANADKFTKGLKQAQSELDRFSRYVNDWMPRGDLLAAGGFVGGFAASSAFVSQQANAIAEQFKELQSAAQGMRTDVATAFDLKGLQADQFEALSPAVANLHKELGRAVMGSQSARKQFDDLGLSWKELAESPVAVQLRIVADRAAEAGNVAERLAIANALLGKSGQDLLPTLEKGAAAFDKAAAAQHRFISEAELMKAGRMEKVVKEETAAWGKAWDQAMEAARIKFRAWQFDMANLGRELLGKEALDPLPREVVGQLPAAVRPPRMDAGRKSHDGRHGPRRPRRATDGRSVTAAAGANPPRPR